MSTTTITTTFGVDGMTCGHCVSAVTSELSALPERQGRHGPAGRSAGRRPSPSSPTRPWPTTRSRAAVVEAGYAVTPRRSLL